MWLLHSGSTLYCCSVEEQEREAGLTRNDYFSLWQAQRYAKFRDDATRKPRGPRLIPIGPGRPASAMAGPRAVA
jgi:hypothetical protein